MSLTERVALVTGAGNPHAIGAAICRALVERGADVCLTFHPGGGESEPSELVAALRSAGARAAAIGIDLADVAAVARLFDEAESRVGAPSILVNNAAHSTPDGYQALDAETLDAHHAVNLRATALLSVDLAGRHAGGRGRIVNLTSGQSLGPMPGELAYAASKGAVDAFTRTLAAELAPLGITVNAVGPGPNDTGWIDAELRRRLLPRFPMGRLGKPDDAAALVAFLVSDEAGWITGQVIHAEGGFLRR